ncbi:MAG: hypothetical protein R2932_51610 [Caldilineaceae bacterium]
MHDERQSGDIDLPDFAAIHTILNGGAVYALAPTEIPGTNAITAAIFRYES